MAYDAKRDIQYFSFALAAGLFVWGTWYSLNLATVEGQEAYAMGVFVGLGIPYCIWLAVRVGTAASGEKGSE